jgi:hypothetical protein
VVNQNEQAIQWPKEKKTTVQTMMFQLLSEYMVALVIFMVFNATFNNISALSWRSVLLMKETGIPGENQRPVASHGQTLNIWVDSCYCYLYICLISLNHFKTVWGVTFVNKSDTNLTFASWNVS